MSSLKLTGINKVYPSGEQALHGVSLEAEDKEFLVILGADNSGKSSLLKVITGVEEQTSGEVFIDGKDMTDVEPKNRDIAMVFNSNTLYPSLNVFDNMAYGLRMRKAPEAMVKERVKVVANILGLNDILYRKPKVLTSAAKQRVAVARAIVREPKLYLFDEPFSGLDDKLRLDMLNLVINLQARVQGTFVYATKNLSEAMAIGTRIVVLKNGFVQQIDTPANLYDYPANTYVAFLIGSPTINFVKGAKIEQKDGTYALVSALGTLNLPESVIARFEGIEEYAKTGKYVTLGIRPEDIEINGEGSVQVTLSKTAEGFTECVVTPDISLNVPAKEGFLEKTAKLKIDLTRLHIFDAETCLTLLKRDEGYNNTGKADAEYVPLPFFEEEAIHENSKPKKQTKKIK